MKISELIEDKAYYAIQKKSRDDISIVKGIFKGDIKIVNVENGRTMAAYLNDCENVEKPEPRVQKLLFLPNCITATKAECEKILREERSRSPWFKEEDNYQLKINGYRCDIQRNHQDHFLNAFISIPETNLLYNVDAKMLNETLSVQRDIDYHRIETDTQEKSFVIGFRANHPTDWIPTKPRQDGQQYRTVAYMEHLLEKTTKKLRKIETDLQTIHEYPFAHLLLNTNQDLVLINISRKAHD